MCARVYVEDCSCRMDIFTFLLCPFYKGLFHCNFFHFEFIFINFILTLKLQKQMSLKSKGVCNIEKFSILVA